MHPLGRVTCARETVPMPDHFDTVDHVAVVVDDIGQAVNWYSSRFRCEVAYQDDTWALVRFANISIAFVLPGHHPRHVGIHREDIEQFGNVGVHRDGVRFVYLEDVSGNVVEVVKRP